MHVACIRASTVDDAIAALAAPRPFRPTLAIVFASVAVDLAAFAAATATLDFPVIGCSSCGEILSCGQGDLVADGSIVGFVLDVAPAAFAVNVLQPAAAAPFDTGQALAAWARSRFADPGLIVLGSGLSLDGERLVEGVVAGMGRGRDIPLYGGLAGDDAAFAATWLIADGRLVGDGVLTLALDCRRIAMHGVATAGWRGLGAAKRVTEAQGNVVFTIDHLPALDTYMRYLDITEDDLPQLGVDYPLLVHTEGGPTVLRAVMGVDKQRRSLTFAGTVPQGANVQFSSCPGAEVLESTRAEIARLKDEVGRADAMLLFSCMARHLALGPDVETEIEFAYQQWGVPLLGFFSYGEIGQGANRACGFHNETYTLLLLADRTPADAG